VPGLVVQHHRLPPDQPLELVGQVAGRRQGRPADQDRDHKDGVAVLQGTVDRCREVLARGDGDHVLEHAVRTEALHQRVGQAPGISTDVTAPVAQEDLHWRDSTAVATATDGSVPWAR
jgi:hypothetical protein